MQNVTCQHRNAHIWTRDKYLRASRLARFLSRRYILLDVGMPPLLDRYFQLWSRYPECRDPLTLPLFQRPGYDPLIPF